MIFSEKVISELIRQGRKRGWLAEELNTSRATLWRKLKYNDFTYEEKKKIEEVLHIVAIV